MHNETQQERSGSAVSIKLLLEITAMHSPAKARMC